jgi:hypothetical protein
LYFKTSSYQIKDLKKLLPFFIENFFPNVANRFINKGHYAHLEVLKIINFMFEYGLFKYSEIEILLKQLYSLTEVLESLELSCARDAKYGKDVTFLSYLDSTIELLRETRTVMAKIMI